MIQMKRRSFITGLIGLVASPAIVKAEWLMPLPKIIKPKIHTYLQVGDIITFEWPQEGEARLFIVTANSEKSEDGLINIYPSRVLGSSNRGDFRARRSEVRLADADLRAPDHSSGVWKFTSDAKPDNSGSG